MPRTPSRSLPLSVLCGALAAAFALAPLAFDALGIPDSAWSPFLGGFHPLLLHLPIGIVFIAVALGVWRLWSSSVDDSIPKALWLAASLTASVSFMSGALMGIDGGFDRELLIKHLWAAGVFTALCWLALALHFAALGAWIRNGVQVAALVAMFAVGHYGGLMVHGDPLAAAPWKEANKRLAILPELGEEIEPYADLVQPILRAKCVSCHGSVRARGDLRLDSLELAIAGGENGPALLIGKPDESLLLKSIHYPLDDDRHMPPKGKPQVSEAEAALLAWWIDGGAGSEAAYARADLPEIFEPFLVANYRLLPDPREEKRALAEREERLREQRERRASLTAKLAAAPARFRSSFTFASQDSAELQFSCFTSPEEFDDKALAKVADLLVECSTVDLSSTGISPAGLATLAFDDRLRTLVLRKVAIGNAPLACLDNASSLESLSLFGTSIGDETAASLAKLSSLKRLYLGEAQLSRASFETLRKALPGCEIVGAASLSESVVVQSDPLQYSDSGSESQDEDVTPE